MKSSTLLTSFVALAAILPVLAVCAEEFAVGEEWAIRIKRSESANEKRTPIAELCVLDGELMFVLFSVNRETPGGRGDPPLPDYSLHFVWDGQMLRVKIAPRNLLVDRKGKFSKELLAKDGWYATADFTTDPPRVLLTEKSTKGSRWALVDAPQESPGRNMFKNQDAPGKALWLTMDAEGKTYRGGIARRPILSSEQKDYFSMEEANSGK